MLGLHLFMEILKIDHIGIVVPNIGSAVKLYEIFGLKVVHEEVLEDRGIRVVFMEGNSSTLLELIEPINQDEQNPVIKFLKSRGPGLHHIAFEVKGIKEWLDKLSKLGFQLVDKEPRRGARGHIVAFIHPKSVMGVLLELVEASH
jgi:methylmalonyl-CoA/ethylmalonyl-CoA epimerase